VRHLRLRRARALWAVRRPRRGKLATFVSHVAGRRRRRAEDRRSLGVAAGRGGLGRDGHVSVAYFQHPLALSHTWCVCARALRPVGTRRASTFRTTKAR
jgi:hypothetical protein